MARTLIPCKGVWFVEFQYGGYCAMVTTGDDDARVRRKKTARLEKANRHSRTETLSTG